MPIGLIAIGDLTMFPITDLSKRFGATGHFWCASVPCRMCPLVSGKSLEESLIPAEGGGGRHYDGVCGKYCEIGGGKIRKRMLT